MCYSTQWLSAWLVHEQSWVCILAHMLSCQPTGKSADVLQENGQATGGVQKSVKTGVANALVALLRCNAPEAIPWRQKVICNIRMLCICWRVCMGCRDWFCSSHLKCPMWRAIPCCWQITTERVAMSITR